MDAEQLPYLETFAKAAELSSFTAAGRALGMTQAAISQRIQALEKMLKESLFDRQGGHVLLTEAGRSLYGYAQRILALHREAIAEITGRETRLQGELMLAASSVPGEYLLPDLLARFQELQPHVVLRATVTDSSEVLQRVEQGQVHLGLVGGRGDSPHLEFRVFAHDELAVVVPGKHPWSKLKQVKLAQLETEPLILREIGSASRSCLEQALARTGKSLRNMRVAMELGSNEAIKEAVKRGMGVTVLSTRAVDSEVRAKKLALVRVADMPFSREMLVVWDRRRVLPIPARLFLELLESRGVMA